MFLSKLNKFSCLASLVGTVILAGCGLDQDCDTDAGADVNAPAVQQPDTQAPPSEEPSAVEPPATETPDAGPAAPPVEVPPVVETPEQPDTTPTTPDVPACECGDGICNGDETQASCSEDCGTPPVEPAACECGDGICNGDETQQSCSDDCGAPPPVEVCGNNDCELYETHDSCPQDCESPADNCFCGDGECDTSETPDTCAIDCGSPPVDEPTDTCGDRSCNNGETFATCAQDCAPQNVDVVKPSANGKTLGLSTFYVDGASCIQVMGELDGGGWKAWGDVTCDADDGTLDGYAPFTAGNGMNGTLRFNYVAAGTSDYATYGVYGMRDYLLANSAESLEFALAPWYNKTTGVNDGSTQATDLYAIYNNGAAVGGGNLGNYHVKHPN